jgi:hypothetical protein
VTSSGGPSEKPLAGMISRSVFTNSSGPPKRTPSSGCSRTATSGFRPCVAVKRSCRNCRETKPKRLIVKLSSVPSVSTVGAPLVPIGERITVRIRSRLGFAPSALGTRRSGSTGSRRVALIVVFHSNRVSSCVGSPPAGSSREWNFGTASFASPVTSSSTAPNEMPPRIFAPARKCAGRNCPALTPVGTPSGDASAAGPMSRESARTAIAGAGQRADRVALRLRGAAAEGDRERRVRLGDLEKELARVAAAEAVPRVERRVLHGRHRAATAEDPLQRGDADHRLLALRVAVDARDVERGRLAGGEARRVRRETRIALRARRRRHPADARAVQRRRAPAPSGSAL